MFRFPYKSVIIDLETTDADKEKGSIIQIGAVAVDKEFNELRSFGIFVAPLDDHRNPRAMKVNGITEEQLEGARSLEHALAAFETFCGDVKQLAAWGAHFDLPFLKAQYDKINRKYPFSYRHLDLKSIALWEMAKKGKPVVSGVERFLNMNGLDFEGDPHDASADAKNTLKIIRHFLD